MDQVYGTSIRTEVQEQTHRYEILEAETTTVPLYETSAVTDSASLGRFSSESIRKPADAPETAPSESLIEVTPEQQYQSESGAVEMASEATELEAETEETLEQEPEHVILSADDTDSPESRNLIIEVVEQQFTEILSNPENWSLDTTQSGDEILRSEAIVSTEIKAYEATEFNDLLDELFGVEHSSEESNPSPVNTDVLPVISKEESAAFFTHLEIFIQEREAQDAEEITEILHEIVTKIQGILESTGVDADALTAEIPAKEMVTLLAACSQIIEFLGYEDSEQNSRKLLHRLLASVQAAQQLDLRNSDTRLWLNTIGTYEHKFDNTLSQLPGSTIVQKLLHQAIGQYVLAKAQTMQ
jgi:hypothetical protein